jgi:radical SAM protein with 4Fe4S-binding SPASM domain
MKGIPVIKNYVRPKLSENIYFEEVGKENKERIFFVLDPDTPSWVFINEVGLEILNLCDGENSIDKISQIISDKHDEIEYKDSFAIVSSFLDNMKRSRILNEKPHEESDKNKFHGLALEITQRCNLRCIHCYLAAGETNNNELTLNEIKEVLKSAKDSGGISVALGGGEPFVRDDSIEIIKFAASLDLLVSLGTNGTLIDRQLAKLLSELPIKIQISLDGASEETNDRIRGEGSFDLAVKGMDNLLNEGMGKDMVIAFTPMKPNFNEIPDIIDFALKRQIPVVQFPPLTSSGRAKTKWSELRLSNDEMLWFWEFVSKRSQELRGKMDLLADCFSIDINRIGVPHRCSIGTQLRVDPHGYVYACQCFHFGSEYCLGNTREKSLKNMVYGQRIEEIKKACFQRPSNINECRRCKWKNFCGGGCMGNAFESSGTILNPESCEVRKKWIEKLFEAKLKEISS